MEFEICTMFTGIIEATGVVKEVISNGSNKTFWISSPLVDEFKVDQSVSHSGVCLTIEEIKGAYYRVTAVQETLEKTTLGTWIAGSSVNIERSLQLNGRLDGHFVQGHVDTTGTCTNKSDKQGSWEFEISYPEKFAPLVIEKGSICINGISLTAFNVEKDRLTVVIIPYTFEHTNIKDLSKGGIVNLEFDMIGKYMLRAKNLAQ